MEELKPKLKNVKHKGYARIAANLYSGNLMFAKNITEYSVKPAKKERNVMAYKNYAQVRAVQNKYREEIRRICKGIDDGPGIYFLTRTDENGINYFYVGQALHILQRMCSHMTGYQHIDLSLKKRKWYSEENPYGWRLNFKHYAPKDLDDMEQYWILQYTKKGYQARYNKTAGGDRQGAIVTVSGKEGKTVAERLLICLKSILIINRKMIRQTRISKRR